MSVAAVALLPELEHVMVSGTEDARAAALQRITALFLSGAAHLNDEQVALFDGVLGRLIDDVEDRALTALSRALAPVGNAPPMVMRRLAHSNDIAVAGPVLQHANCLPESDLVVIARSKGQGHLLAISGRPGLDQPVTDVLVRRGDRHVVRSLARNVEASLSGAGLVALVQRASQDGVLAEHIGQRNDIPAPLFERLLGQATAIVQARLLARAPAEKQAEIRRVLATVAGEIGRPRRDYTSARLRMQTFRDTGSLDEAALAGFAKAGDFEQTVAALALAACVPLEVVDRLINGDKPDPVLILCKATRYSWSTAAAVLSLRLAPGSPAFAEANAQFERIAVPVAERIVHFWRAQPSARAR